MGIPTEHAVYLQRRGYTPPAVGAFTGEEVALLDRFGHWMAALAAGEIEPSTPEQGRFVQVTRGEAEPRTPFERVWIKLRQHQAAAKPPAPAPPAEEAPVEEGPPEGDTRGKFAELLEAREYLADLQRQHEAEREAILSVVRAQLDELEARFAPELEEAARAVEELEGEVRAEVLKVGKSTRLGNLLAVYARGRVTWDSKGLAQYAQTHPELERFRKVGQPTVSLRYKSP